MPMGEPGATTYLSTSGEALLESIVPPCPPICRTSITTRSAVFTTRTAAVWSSLPWTPSPRTPTRPENSLRSAGTRPPSPSTPGTTPSMPSPGRTSPSAPSIPRGGDDRARRRRCVPGGPSRGEQVVITPHTRRGYAAGAVAVTDRNGMCCRSRTTGTAPGPTSSRPAALPLPSNLFRSFRLEPLYRRRG